MTTKQTEAAHPIAIAAGRTFAAARAGLEHAYDYFGSTDYLDHRRMRVALAGISAACDVLKSAANAYACVLGHAARDGSQRG